MSGKYRTPGSSDRERTLVWIAWGHGGLHTNEVFHHWGRGSSARRGSGRTMAADERAEPAGTEQEQGGARAARSGLGEPARRSRRRRSPAGGRERTSRRTEEPRTGNARSRANSGGAGGGPREGRRHGIGGDASPSKTYGTPRSRDDLSYGRTAVPARPSGARSLCVSRLSRARAGWS